MTQGEIASKAVEPRPDIHPWNTVSLCQPRFLTPGLTAVLCCACEVLNLPLDTTHFSPPVVNLQELKIAHTPSLLELAGHYCPAFSSGTLCSLAGLKEPPPGSLRIGVVPNIDIKNPNTFPLVLPEAKFSMGLFEDASQALGTLCLKFCEDGDAACASSAIESVCPSEQDDSVGNLQDRILENLLHATPEEILEDLATLRIQTLPAGSSRQWSIGMDIDLERLFSAVSDASEQLIDTALNTESDGFEIPYSLSGALYFHTQLTGRVPIDFGPLSGRVPLAK